MTMILVESGVVADLDIANAVSTIHEGVDLPTPTLDEDTDKEDYVSDASIEPIENIQRMDVVEAPVLLTLEVDLVEEVYITCMWASQLVG